VVRARFDHNYPEHLTMSISDFADLMNQTVSHAESASTSEYGKPAFGSSADYSARVVYKSKLIRKADGSEVLSKGVIWFQSNVDISVEDEVTLPDGTTPPLLIVERYSDETDGFHHTKVFFG